MQRKAYLVWFVFLLGLGFLAVPALGAGSPVDINSATLAELDTLPGIGPAIAQRIIDYREENGPFQRIEELMDVRGIGEKKFSSLKDQVTVVAPKPPEEAPAQPEEP